MKKLFTLFLTLLVVIVFIGGCTGKATSCPEKYTKYMCYDYHLASLKVECKRFKYRPKDSVDETVSIYFQKIKGESDDEFIYGKITRFMGPSVKVIFQNPDDYVDVLNEWSISQIEFFYIGYDDISKQLNDDNPSRKPSKSLNSTSDTSVFAEFLDFVSTNSSQDQSSLPDGYRLEFWNREDLYHTHTFYIRIHFNESDTIVWDTELKSYYSTELQNRIIVCDKNRVMDGVSIRPKMVVLDENSALFDWLSESLDQLAD